MRQPTRNSYFLLPIIAAVFALLLPLAAWAQTAKTQTQDRWLHVRVESSQPKGSQAKTENVRVNVPLELAAQVLSAINHDHLNNGKIKMDLSSNKDVDLRALFAAIRTARDGEFVTVQDNDSDVRVAKQAGYFLVHVHEKNNEKGNEKEKGGASKEQVEIRIPVTVAEAMLSASHDELDLLAAIRALSSQDDTELVSVKSSEETVRIWLDSKNHSD